MAYSWENRIDFVVRSLYDIDGNGYVDERDFMCWALRATIIENKGDFNYNKFQEFQHIMLCLWEEVMELADFDKDLLNEGKISINEFKEAIQYSCYNRKFNELPQALKMFIDTNFKLIDLNEDGIIDLYEFRYYCVTKFAIDNLEAVNDAFNNLLNDDDRIRGGIVLSRYQELYAQFLGNKSDNCLAIYLFGPLTNLKQI